MNAPTYHGTAARKKPIMNLSNRKYDIINDAPQKLIGIKERESGGKRGMD